MTKKQSKIKKVKKAVKPTKITLSFKKGKPDKPGKNVKDKAVNASARKASKLSSKVAKKKIVAKKNSKPVKKAINVGTSKSARSLGKKASKTLKPVKKIAAKKTPHKRIPAGETKAISKNAITPEKKIVKKTKQPEEINNLIVTKPAKTVKIVKKEKTPKVQKIEGISELIKPGKKSKGGRKPKNKNDDDDEPVIENDILIEQLINSTRRLKKPSKVPKQLRTFTNPMASLAIAKPADGNKKGGSSLPKKEPKGKFELEYVMHTSPGILYEFLTSPSGLAEWFADDVNIHDGVFTFFWEGSEQKARLLGFKEEKYVRLQWLDKPDGTYFEFRIERDELTGDISLIITDFADEAADLKTSKLLWDSQVNQLLHVIGSY